MTRGLPSDGQTLYQRATKGLNGLQLTASVALDGFLGRGVELLAGLSQFPGNHAHTSAKGDTLRIGLRGGEPERKPPPAALGKRGKVPLLNEPIIV